jgi:hypothetical protein
MLGWARRNSSSAALEKFPLTVLHEVDQEIEHLRFDGNPRGATAQFAPVGVKRVPGKKKLHLVHR